MQIMSKFVKGSPEMGEITNHSFKTKLMNQKLYKNQYVFFRACLNFEFFVKATNAWFSFNVFFCEAALKIEIISANREIFGSVVFVAGQGLPRSA